MYTAQELVWATQLAYCNFDADFIEDYFSKNHEYPTVQYLMDLKDYETFYNYNENTDPTGDNKTMRDTTIAFIDDVIAGKICQGWKVVSILDKQDKEGIYGITIETGVDDAIIAFRGSESMTSEGLDIGQLIKDWVVADFTIINGYMTKQEEAA